MVGKKQEPVEELIAGDIGALSKLDNARTGDTLYEKVNSSKAEEIQIYYTKQDNGYSKDPVDIEIAKGTTGIRYYKKNKNIDNDDLSTYEII